MSVFVLDLIKYMKGDESCFAGRDDGRAFISDLRDQGIDLDQLEQNYREIHMVVPDQIVTINYSFFEGAFSDRVRRLGKIGFEEKYKFITSPFIEPRIKMHIDRCLFVI